jgi:hypothetical protein
MEKYSIERKNRGDFDLLITNNKEPLMDVRVEGWFGKYNFHDSSTKKLLCSISGGVEKIFISITHVFLVEENIEISMRNKVFSNTNNFIYLDKNYKIITKTLDKTEIFENDKLILKMINIQKNTLYSGSMEVVVYESENLALLFALLIWYCSDFSWFQ